MKNRTGFTRRAGLAALATCALALAATPAGAAAAPSSVSVYEYDYQSADEGFDGFIHVDAIDGDRTRHLIEVSAAGGTEYLVTDSAGLRIAPNTRQAHEQEQKCVAVNEFAVRCGLPTGYDSGVFNVEAGAAADVVDMRAAGTELVGSVSPGRGNDRVLGGPGDDWLNGGGGNDVLIGYLGNDTLMGDRGNDVIRSRDGLRDEITCGGGDDRREKAIKDRFDRKVSIEYGGSWVDYYPISC